MMIASFFYVVLPSLKANLVPQGQLWCGFLNRPRQDNPGPSAVGFTGAIYTTWLAAALLDRSAATRNAPYSRRNSGGADHKASASSLIQTVRSPRGRRLSLYLAHFVTRCFCLAIL